MRCIVTLVFLGLAVHLGGCGGGGGGSNSASVPPPNSAPRASFTVNETNGYAPLTVEFDGSSSNDSDGSITTYTWHTGDGSSYADSKIRHTYTTLGSFSATLTVTDDDGASSSESMTIDVFAQAVGPYYGDACSDVTGQCIYVFGLIGSDNRVFLDGYDYGIDEWNRSFAGSTSVVGDSLTGTLLAEIYGSDVFLDGSQIGDVVIDADVVPQSEITGTYSGVGDHGVVELVYNTPIDNPASLSDIAGTWSWSDGQGYMQTMVVDENGSFVTTDTLGCEFRGQFSLMDLRRNEYDTEYTLTCPPGINAAGDGKRKGLALIDNFYETDIWLYWWVTFQEGPMAGRTGGSSLSRPRTTGSIANDMEKSKPVTMIFPPQHPHNPTRIP